MVLSENARGMTAIESCWSRPRTCAKRSASFTWLDAPIQRLGALDTPVPAAQALEEIFSPKVRLLPALRALLAY